MLHHRAEKPRLAAEIPVDQRDVAARASGNVTGAGAVESAVREDDARSLENRGAGTFRIAPATLFTRFDVK